MSSKISIRTMHGACEWHKGFAGALYLVSMSEKILRHIEDPIEKASCSGPIYVCNKCKCSLNNGLRAIPECIWEKDVKISELLNNQRQIEMANVFIELKENFSSIKHVYIIPSDSVPDKYKASINFGIDISSFSALSYTAWALSNCSSAMSLWEDEKSRSKFWQAKILKLLMALGRFNCDIDDLEIWIRSGSRIFHINHFVRNPSAECLKIVPGSLIRLEK